MNRYHAAAAALLADLTRDTLSQLEQLADQADVDPGWLRAHLHREIEQARRQKLAQPRAAHAAQPKTTPNPPNRTRDTVSRTGSYGDRIWWVTPLPLRA